MGHGREQAEDHEGTDDREGRLPVVEEHREGVRTLVADRFIGAVDFLLGLGNHSGGGEGSGIRGRERYGKNRNCHGKNRETFGELRLVDGKHGRGE